MIGAALREGYARPLFIQGDHCQVNAKKYQADPEGEVGEVKKLIAEEIGAGFYNIDIDTSTLVDLSQPTLDEQQRLNYERAAEITALHPRARARGRDRVRGRRDRRGRHEEQHRRGAARLHDGLQRDARGLGGARGISKICVQTGTSHGGVVLPDGTIADVKLDLQALAALSRVAREEYGLAGAVQHGASTLPASAFGKFPRIETAEIHLATNFQNIVFDHPQLPAELQASGCWPGSMRTPQGSARRRIPRSSSTTRRGRRRSGRSSAMSGRCRRTCAAPSPPIWRRRSCSCSSS